MSEQDARLVINKKLEDSGWVLTGTHKNVKTEESCDSGFADYLLLGRKGQNLAVIEAKADSYGDVYLAKDQAHGYAFAMGCRYLFIAN